MAIKVEDDELLAAPEDGESWSDDPVRMYLTQMGEIPLLTRQQEIYLARQIEVTRAPLPPQAAGVRLRDSACLQSAASASTQANCRSIAPCRSR